LPPTFSGWGGAPPPHGRVVATAARSTHDLSPLHGKGLSLHVVFMLLPMLRDEGREKHGRILRELATLVEAGKVRPLLDPHRFDLAHAADAHRHLESGKAVGKVVVEIA
jgi:NADPH2:quinone reductase